MAVNEQWYAPQGTSSLGYLDISYTYPFNNASYPDYKQPVNTPIDPSIWFICRPNNEYAYGRTFTQWFSRDGVNIEIHEKSNGFVNNYSVPTVNSDNAFSLAYLTQRKWAPFVISSYANAQFARKFDYNNFIIVPEFAYFIPNDETGIPTITTSAFYNNVPDNAKIVQIRLRHYYGVPNYRTEVSYQTNYVQYAGGYYETNGATPVNYVSGTFYAKYINLLFLTTYALSPVYFYSWRKNLSNNKIDAIQVGNFYQFSLFDEYIYVNGNSEHHVYYIDKLKAFNIMNALGYYWSASGNRNSELGKNCTDPDVYCPIIDPNNNTVTDDWRNGDGIADYAEDNPDSNFNWEDETDEIREKTPQDTAEETEEIDLFEPILNPINGMSNYWVLSTDVLNQFAQWIWNSDDDIFDLIVKGLALLGGNPLDAIISIKMYPFEIGNYFDKEYKNIFFGRVDSNILGQHINKSHVLLDLGSATYNPPDRNFLGYEPYTKAWLYIPYCGIVSVSPTEFVNKQINVKMVIDITTGTCTAIVYSAGIPILYKDGVIGVDIPVTGYNMSEWANNFISAATGAVGGVAGGLFEGAISAMGAETRGVVVGAVLDTAKGAFSISQNIGTSIEKHGSSSPCNNMYLPQKCYLIFESVESALPENYGHTTGFMCLEHNTIGNFTGFSIFENVDVKNITGATETEKTAIKTYLESGVYL